jgi:AAA domain
MRRVDPRVLGAALGVDLDNLATHNVKTEAKKTAIGERPETEEFDLDKYPAVKAAVFKNSPDRSADTYGVMGACVRAGLTFPQACWAVYQSDRLAGRLADRKEDDRVDLTRCWMGAVDDRQREAQGSGKAGPGRVISLLRATDIHDDIPDWAWEWEGVGRIQLAVLTLFAGRPGTGKSTAGRWFAAQWSKGELPGLWHGTPQTVAYIAPEESLRYVVKPGLRAAGADMSRLVFPEVKFNDNAVPLIAETDEHRLTEEFLAQGVTVVIVDPIMATIDRKVDIYRNNEMRAALAPWVNIAQVINGTVDGVVHLRKGNVTDVVGAMNGSSAFGEVARCVFGFVKDPDDRKARVMSQVKNSCGPEDLSLTYEIRGQPVTTDSGRSGEMPLFVMRGESDISVEEILGISGGRATLEMRRLTEFVNGRGETDAEAVVMAELAKDHKLASQKLNRLHTRGEIAHLRHGVFGPVKPRKEGK